MFSNFADALGGFAHADAPFRSMRHSGRRAVPVDAPFRSTRRSDGHGEASLYESSIVIQLSTYIFLIRYELWLAQHLDQRHSLG
jgi:hypothetical protein